MMLKSTGFPETHGGRFYQYLAKLLRKQKDTVHGDIDCPHDDLQLEHPGDKD
jgi:hypothetical protein